MGNIDYSDYESTATIDVSTWKGAGHIWAAQDDTTIYDNATQNIITLGDGSDYVYLTNTATTDETNAAAIDQIIDFTHGDDQIQIDLNAADFAFKTAGLTDYASFLTWATAALADNTALADVAVGVFGGNSYVAVDVDGGGTLDFAVELVGVTNVDASDFVIV